jgi:hypothetical protein
MRRGPADWWFAATKRVLTDLALLADDADPNQGCDGDALPGEAVVMPEELGHLLGRRGHWRAV